MNELTLTPAGVINAGVFLGRLTRLDPGAVVRLRQSGEGRLALWARLPWEVLATRTIDGTVAAVDAAAAAGDATVAARELLPMLGSGALPSRRDTDWRWGLPSSGGRAVESLPAAQLRALAMAAEQTVRGTAAGRSGTGTHRPVGERVIRDALLDHVAIVVHATVSNSTVKRIDIPQRLVQAVVRMGFLRSESHAAESPVRVLVAGAYVGLAAEYGVVWYRSTFGLAIGAIG